MKEKKENPDSSDKGTKDSMTARTQGWEARTITGSASQPRPDLRRDSNGVAIGPWTGSVQRLNKTFWDQARRRI